jgi:hypothetical protein
VILLLHGLTPISPSLLYGLVLFQINYYHKRRAILYSSPLFSTLPNDYNLAAGRYKPQIAEKAPDEDPAELIRETLTIEREITEGLERLLKKVER